MFPRLFLITLTVVCGLIFIENELSAGGTENYYQERMIASGGRICSHFMFLLFTCILYIILPLLVT